MEKGQQMIDINTPDTGNCFYAMLYGNVTTTDYGKPRLSNQIRAIFEAAAGEYTNENNCIIIPTYDESIIDTKMWDSDNSTWDNPTLIDAPFMYVAKVETDRINVGNAESNEKLTDKLLALEVAKGSYTGDGAATRTIELGFTPSAVFVSRNDGVTFDGSTHYGGLAIAGNPVLSADNLEVITVVENGFNVARAVGVNTNMSLTTYNFVAFK